MCIYIYISSGSMFVTWWYGLTAAPMKLNFVRRMLDSVYELSIKLKFCSMNFICITYQDSVCTSQRSNWVSIMKTGQLCCLRKWSLFTVWIIRNIQISSVGNTHSFLLSVQVVYVVMAVVNGLSFRSLLHFICRLARDSIIIIIIIIIKSFYSLWSIGHPWRASRHCGLQLSPWPRSVIFLCFLSHLLLSFATFSSAYVSFYIHEDSNLMQFSLLLLFLCVMCVQSNSIIFFLSDFLLTSDGWFSIVFCS